METKKQELIRLARICAHETGVPFARALEEIRATQALEEVLKPKKETMQEKILRLRRERAAASLNVLRLAA